MKKIFAMLLVTLSLAFIPMSAQACIPGHILYGTVTKAKATITYEDGTKATLKKYTIVKKTGWERGKKAEVFVPTTGKTGYILRSKLKRVVLLRCKGLHK